MIHLGGRRGVACSVRYALVCVKDLGSRVSIVVRLGERSDFECNDNRSGAS